MKKAIIPVLLITVLLLAACGSGGKTETTTERQADHTADVREYMEAHVMADVAPLLEDDWLTVTTASDGKVNITVRAFMPYYIPYAAEAIIPTAQAAIEESGAELGIFTVNYYTKNNFGIVDGTMVDWHTSDWEKGTFSSAEDENKIIPNATISDLYEYYSDWDEFVQKVLNGEYDE